MEVLHPFHFRDTRQMGGRRADSETTHAQKDEPEPGGMTANAAVTMGSLKARPGVRERLENGRDKKITANWRR